MTEYEFRCEKCDAVWYATDKDIRASKKLKGAINKASRLRFAVISPKKYVKESTQIAQMAIAYKDYGQCVSCGSRQVTQTKTNT